MLRKSFVEPGGIGWAGLSRWLRRDHMVRNALYLMLSAGLQAGLGMAFWIVTARLYPVADVGTATSLISASTLVAYVALVGMNSTFVRYLPTAPAPNALVTAGLLVVGVCAAVLAGGYVLLTPVLAPALSFVAGSPAPAVGFVLLTVACAVNLVTDAVFVAARKAGVNAVLDGGIGGATKIVSALVLAGSGAFGLYVAGTGGYVTAGLASLVLMVVSLRYRPAVSGLRAALRPLMHFSGANYLGNVLNFVPGLVVPPIVLNRLGAASAAYYFVAFQVATLLYSVSAAVEQSFLAEGSYAEEDERTLFRRSLRVVAVFCGVGCVALVLAGPLVLSVLGPAYREHGAGALVVLALAALPIGALHWLLTVLRLTGRLRAVVVSNAVYAIAVCLLAWVLAPHGLVALAAAWPAGSLLAAVTAGGSARGVLRAPRGARRCGRRARTRVLIVSSYAPPHVGGLEIVVAQQAQTLAAQGHDVTLVTSRCGVGEPRREAVDGYTVVRVPAWNALEERWGVPFPVWGPGALVRLARLAARADVVHVHDVFYVPSMMGVATARLCRRPLFLTQHVAVVEHTPLVRRVQELVYRTAGRLSWRSAAQITVYNPIVRSFLVGHGVPATRIHLRYNGIDVRRFSPADATDRRAMRRRHGLPDDRPVVLFVGRLVPKKGFDKLVAAADPAYHLVFAGSGRIPEPVPPGVTFLGPVDRGDLPGLYRAADAFAFPAVGEMLTLVMQEAMACGLPVVTTAEPAYEHYDLDPDGIAFVAPEPVELRRTLIALLADPERLARMSRYSRALAEERFDWQANVDRPGELEPAGGHR
jgi:glycosyltransferase involved in cell wall biosynthesis/O-antigen/teichoic acid export membrane protein